MNKQKHTQMMQLRSFLFQPKSRTLPPAASQSKTYEVNPFPFLPISPFLFFLSHSPLPPSLPPSSLPPLSLSPLSLLSPSLLSPSLFSPSLFSPSLPPSSNVHLIFSIPRNHLTQCPYHHNLMPNTRNQRALNPL